MSKACAKQGEIWRHVAFIDEVWYIDGMVAEKPDWIGDFNFENKGIWLRIKE